MSSQIALLTAAGISGNFIQFLQKIMTPEQMAQLNPEQIQQIVDMGAAFNALIKDKADKYAYSIAQAKKAVLKCSFLSDEQKIQVIDDVDASSMKPSILVAFFSTFNVSQLITVIITIVTLIILGMR